MPTLPNGQRLGLSLESIMPPGFQFFPCPPGHFWHQRVDVNICGRPLVKDQEVLRDFVHSPVPQSRREAGAFIDVLRVDGKQYWLTGYNLSDFERPSDWSNEDWRVWTDWLAQPEQRAFVDKRIERCREQAESLDPGGHLPAFRASPTNPPTGDDRTPVMPR